MFRLWVLVFGLGFALESSAAGTIIVAAIAGSAWVAANAALAAVIAFAINMVVSTVISKALFSPNQPSYDGSSASASPNPGNRQQIPPATDNKLPVVYGSAWVGGTIVDLSISNNNQELYYVLALSEVTNSNSGQSPDNISFGDIYYGGKKVTFKADGHTVASLTDESTGIVDTKVADKIRFYLYRNGSNQPANSSQSAIQVLSNPDLIYKWDNTKLMSNSAFAIIHLTYNNDAGIRGIEQTRFQIINSRSAPGDCISDYLVNTRYGAALSPSQINNTSLQELNSYSSGSFAYTDANGNPATQARFRFDGTLDTNRTIMQNLQDMASCCDCVLKYNEMTAQWGVIVQKPTYTVAMDINDSNIVSAIQITPIDLNNSFNIIECKFPDKSNQDAFNTATFDLAQIDPALLFPNEPVNKQSVSLPLVNDNVRAQYIANRLLKGAREDLQVDCSVGYIGLQFEAGDIVTITNANYGWVAKLFRINKCIETFKDDGSIVVQLILMEFNPSIYDDASITAFQPSPNTGIGDPLFFGTIPAPTIVGTLPNSADPTVIVGVTSASSGISQYGEVWYSAFSNPTSSQRFFAGTTAINASGAPYNINASMGNVTVANLPLGNWYFFSRMVNSLGNSIFSPPSALVEWRPTTVQYANRYLVVAYADNATGTSGFTSNPRNKAYYGISNQTSSSPITNPASFTWYLANPAFSTDNFLLFTNRGSRKFTLATGTANYAASTGAFVPTDTALYDPSLWSGLPDGTNYIDLDKRTGQLTETGTTTVGTGEIQVKNNADGRIVASLAAIPALQSLAGGAGTYTATVAKLTIDIYGRVLGFEPPDDFGYSMQQFTASAGQTVFNVSRTSRYRINNCWVFQNGVWLEQSEFTDTGGTTGTVTLDTGADLFDIITIVSFAPYNTTTGSYDAFTIQYVDLTNASSYTASGFTLVSGYELLFLNGTVVNDQDYDIVGQTITNFPNLVTGKLAILQWSNNNLGVQNGTPINEVTNSVIGQDTYPFSYVANALNIYQNGVLLDEGTDYTAGFGDYVLDNVPTDINQILLQQTFNRTGAA
jgi:hypothetical protein